MVACFFSCFDIKNSAHNKSAELIQFLRNNKNENHGPQIEKTGDKKADTPEQLKKTFKFKRLCFSQHLNRDNDSRQG